MPGVDAQLEPVRNAVVWMDERAHEQVRALRDSVGEDQFHAMTGKPLSLTPSVTKILWMRDHEPHLFSRVHRWLDVQAYLLWHLTGEDATSVGSADPMGMVDLRAGTWSPEILRAASVREHQMPRLLPSGTCAGTLLPAIAAKVGLPAGLPVIATAGDGQVAALGAQVFDGSRAYLNLGTAIVSGTVTSDYRTDRAFRTMSGAMPGTYLLESDLKGGTFTLDWFLRTVLRGSLPLEALEREAAALAPGADGLVLVPYLAGVMNPYCDDDASGVLLGLRGHHGAAHVLRAIFEGIAMEMQLHLDAISAAARAPMADVHALGGGAGSDLWCQILADVLGRRVTRTRSQEATSLGAAMLAAAAIGWYPCIRDAAAQMGGLGQSFSPGPNAPRYERLARDVYREIYPG
ncbi:MAG: FGGY family carbohydrate kinase [Polyangiaceae bacterium]|nr:FGGY family carbohydrate kinase [Polyangiaceae bacterium]